MSTFGAVTELLKHSEKFLKQFSSKVEANFSYFQIELTHLSPYLHHFLIS
jgi:hypothetical protein